MDEDTFTQRLSSLPNDNLLVIVDMINLASFLHHIHCSEDEILDALGQRLIAGENNLELRIDVVWRPDFGISDYQKVA